MGRQSYALRNSSLGIVLCLINWYSTAHSQEVVLVAEAGHTAPVYSLAYSPDEKLLASAAGDNTIKVWDAKSGQQLNTFYFAGGSSAVRFSPSGRVLAGVDFSGKVKLWELRTGKEFATLEPQAFGPYSFSSDGGNLQALEEGGITVWNLDTGQKLKKVSLNPKRWPPFAVAPDGKHTLSLVYGNSLQVMHLDRPTVRVLKGHTGRVRLPTFSSDGSRFATFGDDNKIRLWNLITGKLIRVIDGYNADTLSLAFSSDNKLLAAGSGYSDKLVRIWQIDTGRLITTLTDHSAAVSALAFSDENRTLATGSWDKTVKLWNVQTGELLRTLGGRTDGIGTPAFSDDSKVLAVVNFSDYSVKLWDAETGRLKKTLVGHDSNVVSLVFSPSGKRLATGSFNGFIKIWDVETGSELKTLSGHRDGVNCLLFVDDGKTLISGSKDHTVRTWDVETGAQLKTFTGSTSYIFSIAVSRDNKYLAAVGDDTNARVWDMSTTQLLRTFEGHKAQVNSVAFSPNGNVLATGTNTSAIKLWEIAAGREIRTLTEDRMNLDSPVTSLAFSGDGKLLASGGWNELRLWNVEKGVEVNLASNDPVTRLREVLAVIPGLFRGDKSNPVSPDHRLQIRSNQDGMIKLLNLTTGTELPALIAFDKNDWINVFPDGRFDTNKSLDRIDGLHWALTSEPLKPWPLEIFMRDYYEPRLVSRILKGEKLQKLPSIAELNRNRAQIVKIEVMAGAPDAETVDVAVWVLSTPGICLRDGKDLPCESGVYDLRLYRDGQLVQQSPVPPAEELTIESQTKTWREQLQQWRSSHLVIAENGLPITTSSGIQRVVFRRVCLPKRTGVSQVEFTAYAFNEDRVKSTTSTPKSHPLRQSPSENGRRAYIIVVGVDATSDPLLRLGFGPKSATEIERALKEKLAPQYEVISVPLLSIYNEEINGPSPDLATKTNLQNVLKVLSGDLAATQLGPVPGGKDLRAATPDDLVVVYIVSHGYADSIGKFYIIPSDIGESVAKGKRSLGRCLKNKQSIDCKSAIEFLRHSISSDELTQWLRTIDAGEMVLILDSCHSGAVSGPAFKPGPMGDRGFGQLSYDKAMLVLAATQAENVGWGTLTLGDRSLLTIALTQSQDAKKSFDMRDWLSRAEKEVPELYQKFVKTNELMGSSERLDQEPVLFDFSKRRPAKESPR